MSSIKKLPIERIILAFTALVLLIGNFFLSGSAASVSNKIALVGIIALGLYYGWQLKDKWGGLCAALALTLVKDLLDAGDPFRLYLYYAYLGIHLLLAVLFIIKTISESRKNKDWELFGTLISLSFLYPLLHHLFFLSEAGYIMVYHFAVAFLIAYVMYYENLWDKYNKGEKSILMLVMAINVYAVLLISFKNLL